MSDSTELDQEIAREANLSLEAIAAVNGKLRTYTVPDPTLGQTQALIQVLAAEMKAQGPAQAAQEQVQAPARAQAQAPTPGFAGLYPDSGLQPQDLAGDIGFRDVVAAVLAQIKFYPAYVWLVAGALLFLGAAATAFFAPYQIHLLVALVPWIGSLITFYGIHQTKSVWADLEACCPISPEVLVLGRWLAAVILDILVATAVSAATVQLGWEASLGQLLWGWLAPLMFSSALALFLTLKMGMPQALVALTSFWALEVLAREHLGPFNLLAVPGQSPGLLSQASALALAAVLVAGSLRTLKYVRGNPPPYAD